MSEVEPKLTHPPIIEAVLDIECDLPPGQQIAALEAPARKLFLDRYPKLQQSLLQEVRIDPKPDEPLVVSTRHEMQAFQFFQNDKKQLVQVRTQGYSFNRLAPYTSLDDYMPEIERTWHLYLELAKPIKIRLIRLRYINRILLPLPTVGFTLEDYFSVGPRLPREANLAFIGFLDHHAAREIKTGNLVNIVLAAQKQEGDILPVIFDNGVESSEPGDPEEWSWIREKILVLRDLKNRIFRSTLTPKCLDLFQQQ